MEDGSAWDEVWERIGTKHAQGSLGQLSGFTRKPDELQAKGLVNHIVNATKLPEHGTVLEFGCAAGRLAEHFIRLGYEYQCVEKSESLIQEFTKRFGGTKITRSTDLTLAFPDNSFDVVFCYSVLHYLTDHEQTDKLLKEMMRVSKGVVYLGDIETVDWTTTYGDTYSKTPHLTHEQRTLDNIVGNFKHEYTAEFVHLPSRYNCIVYNCNK